jgi:hypothetical protein
MNAKEIITTTMKQSGLNQTQMASMVGLKNQSGFSMALSRADLKVGFFVKVLNAMGYEVVVQKRTRGRKAEGAIVVSVDCETDS